MVDMSCSCGICSSQYITYITYTDRHANIPANLHPSAFYNVATPLGTTALNVESASHAAERFFP